MKMRESKRKEQNREENWADREKGRNARELEEGGCRGHDG
jgi:hypothetical protein